MIKKDNQVVGAPEKYRIRRAIVSNDVAWWLIRKTLGKLGKIYGRLSSLRDGQADTDLAEWCGKHLASATVLHGPFKGMVYPQLSSMGSTLYPKLLGSYESELTDVMRYITSQGYHTVVDIGCAEGYYAVGLGRVINGSTVYAYDTNQQALEMCQAMADKNGVTLETGGFCDQTVLKSLDFGAKALIISDCEGYEKELFDAGLCEYLRPHDLLIETHDFLDIETSGQLINLFSKTHDVQVIESVDDLIKAYTYKYEELVGLPLRLRMKILEEQRPATMRWLFAKAYSSSN